MTLEDIFKLLRELATGEVDNDLKSFHRLLQCLRVAPTNVTPLVQLYLSFLHSNRLNIIHWQAPAFYVLITGAPVPEGELERFDPATLHLAEG